MVSNIPAKKRRFPHRLVFRVAASNSRLRMGVMSKAASSGEARHRVSRPRSQYPTTTVRDYSMDHRERFPTGDSASLPDRLALDRTVSDRSDKASG